MHLEGIQGDEWGWGDNWLWRADPSSAVALAHGGWKARKTISSSPLISFSPFFLLCVVSASSAPSAVSKSIVDDGSQILSW